MSDAMILRRGGGSDLAIRVMIGTVQPAGKAGRLWVNTALTGEKWTVAVAEPVNPASGDLWVQTDAESAHVINLIKRNNAANVNILRVKQYVSGKWESKAAYYHNSTSWTQVSTTFNPTTDIQFTGNKTLLDDGNGHWRVKLLTSGTLTFLNDPGIAVDVYCLGGGGGTPNVMHLGGGGSGYTTTGKSLAVAADTGYPVIVGAGGTGVAGGTSSALGISAAGGAAPSGTGGAAGGCGGGAYGSGGTGGTNGGNGGGTTGGTGQGTNMNEFGETAGALYGGGGGGAIASGTLNPGGNPYGATGGGYGAGSGSSAAANTGGGAGGGYEPVAAASGGSGIVVIRDHRAA